MTSDVLCLAKKRGWEAKEGVERRDDEAKSSSVTCSYSQGRQQTLATSTSASSATTKLRFFLASVFVGDFSCDRGSKQRRANAKKDCRFFWGGG